MKKINKAIYFIDSIILLLQPKIIRAFDGDGFVWIWREPKDHVFAEVKTRVRPDSLSEGAEIQIGVMAWNERELHGMQSFVYFMHYYSNEDLVYKEIQIKETITAEFNSAWQKAIDMRDKILNVS